MGRYVYRLVLKRSGNIIETTAARVIYSYGTVTLAQLCRGTLRLTMDMNGRCETGGVAVGNQDFAYSSIAEHFNTGPNQRTEVSSANSSCRSITVHFATSNDEIQADQTTRAGAIIRQATAAAQAKTVPAGTIGTLSAALTSRNWDVSMWSDSGDYVYYTVTLSCYTRSAVR